MRSRKAQCQALPDNPETGDTYHKERKKPRWRENRKQSTKTYTSTAAAAAQPPPPANTTTTHTYDSKEHNYWVELVRVCRLAVVAAAAACCSFRVYENPPPPNETRAIRREGRRAVSAQLAGRLVSTCILFRPWVGPFCESISHMFERIEL